MFQYLQNTKGSPDKNSDKKKNKPGLDYSEIMQWQSQLSKDNQPIQKKDSPDNNSNTPAVASENSSEDSYGPLINTSDLPLPGITDVNIHQNSNEAKEMGALAFTQGSEIHFAPGKFNPGTGAGKELLGHELAHVKQQNEGRVKPTVQTKKIAINDDKGLEKEADDFGKKYAQGNYNLSATSFSGKTNIVLSRSPGQAIQKRDVEFVNYNDVAKDIYTAIKGAGTDEEKVYLALSKLRKNPAAISKLKQVYKTKYKSNLVSDLKGDFSGSEWEHVKSLLATGETFGSRKERKIDYSKLAKKIYGAIKGAGTNEEAVYSALLELNNNPILIKKLKDEYKSKYKVDLYTHIAGDMEGSELKYVLELLKDKTAKEQVNVQSKKEADEAKKIIKAIKDDYGIEINSKAGVDAIKKDYSIVPKKVLDQLNTTAWEYKELVALKAALDIYAPILGDKRKKSKRKGAAQEITTIGKVDQAIFNKKVTAKLDDVTLGEYFRSSKNFSLFTCLTDLKNYNFKSNNKQILGTSSHEIAHGLLKYALPDFVKKMDYWRDTYTKSGKKGAEEPITTYGKKNASEDLSETMSFYSADPSKLKTKCPKRYKFVQTTIKNWK